MSTEEKQQLLLLKWGTIKGWDLSKESKVLDLLQDYFSEGQPMSCALDRPDDDRKKILCQIIDKFNGIITNDWSGEQLTKEQAKKYVMEYGQ